MIFVRPAHVSSKPMSVHVGLILVANPIVTNAIPTAVKIHDRVWT
jgi:hypothetical protein